MDSIGSNLPRIKLKNQFAIKEAIYKFGPISRHEISKRLELTLPTITTNVSLMIKKGLLKETEGDNCSKKLGRKTMLVDINENYGLFMGIEIRGTARRSVVVNTRGKVLYSRLDDNPCTEYEDALNSAFVLYKELISECKNVLSICLCIPGIVDRNEGVLVIHPEYKWSDKNLREDWKKLTGYNGPIYCENNTIARTFGVSIFEKEILNGADTSAYMFISQGIGCPLLRDTKLHFGYLTGDGEVGHMVMKPNGPKCGCGNKGCLEAFSSDRAVVEKAMKKIEEGSSIFLEKRLKDKGSISVLDVMEGAKNGDKESVRIVNEAIEYLALAISNVDNFVRPECVIIEGILFKEEENRKTLLSIIHKNLYLGSFSDSRFIFKDNDEFGGAKGAAAVAIKNYLELYFE